MSATSSIPASSDSPQVAELKRELQWAYLKIQVLEQRLRLQRIQEVRSGEREAQRRATGASGTGTWGEQRRSAGGERARTSAGTDGQPEAPAASGTAGTAGGVCRAWSA